MASVVMYSILKIFSILCVVSSITACQSILKINVTLDGKESLVFTGRGSAAGMMLDSVIPGGIAIGIAIDEGIAKDINANLISYSPDFSIQNLIQSQIDNKFDRNLSRVKVNNYGFRVAPKGEDQVSAWLDLEFICKNKSHSINYPQYFSEITTADFAVIKVDGKASYDLLNQSVIQVFNKWKSDGQCGKFN